MFMRALMSASELLRRLLKLERRLRRRDRVAVFTEDTVEAEEEDEVSEELPLAQREIAWKRIR